MIDLKYFTPNEYNNLTIEEKREIIEELANDIFEELDIEPIPVYFNDIDREKTSWGMFLKAPPCILINNYFLNNNEAKKHLSDAIDVDAFLPYFLVYTIAHECYHYHQFCLINRFADGENLSEKEKELASLYFISLYEKIFYAYCLEKGLIEEGELSRDQVYNFSPAETSANSFADKYIEKLEKVDNNPNNYIYYNYNMILNEASKGPNMRDKVIQHNLDVALTFLKYKNMSNGKKNGFLGIDVEKLEITINNILKKEQSKKSGINTLLKKINKK